MGAKILAFSGPGKESVLYGYARQLDLDLLIEGMEDVVAKAGIDLFKQVGVDIDRFMTPKHGLTGESIEDYYQRVNLAAHKAIEKIQERQVRYEQAQATLGALKELQVGHP